MEVNDRFDTLDSLRRFLTADTEDDQTAKRQVMHDLLAEPARQFALVRQRANHYEPLPPDEKSYYNVYPTERTLYLNLFARRGFPTNET